MRVLLHVCCGPCSIMPVRELLRAGHDVVCWFYNPNIQPLAEYLRRRAGAVQAAAAHGVSLLFPEKLRESADLPAAEYDVTAWCEQALRHANGRCAYCRESRFHAAAATARALGFDAFTSSLLYSRHQNHEGMRDAGEKAAARHAVPFFYQDFRPFWQEGIAASKTLGIYRQQYCGCVFSEEERYARDLDRVTASTSGSEGHVTLQVTSDY